MAERYRVAEKLVFAKMAKWQQEAITEDRQTGRESSLLTQFAKDVIKMAENMENPPPAKPTKATKHQRRNKGKSFQTPPWHDTNGANGNDYCQEA